MYFYCCFALKPQGKPLNIFMVNATVNSKDFLEVTKKNSI